MDSALKSQLHGSEVANSALGIIREETENKTDSIVAALYKSVVHLHLEYYWQFQLCLLQKDMPTLGKILKESQGNEGEKIGQDISTWKKRCWSRYMTKQRVGMGLSNGSRRGE